MEAPDKEFVFQLTDWQGRLFGYLVTLLGNLHDARDVLQETNLVLWRKIGDFDPGSDFGAWARSTAYFQALAFRRDRKRDRLVFDDELLGLFESDDQDSADEEERELALRDCLGRLPDEQRELVQARYRDDGAIRELAEKFSKTESGVKMTLMRIRQALLGCIESKLKEIAG